MLPPVPHSPFIGSPSYLSSFSFLLFPREKKPHQPFFIDAVGFLKTDITKPLKLVLQCRFPVVQTASFNPALHFFFGCAIETGQLLPFPAVEFLKLRCRTLDLINVQKYAARFQGLKNRTEQLLFFWVGEMMDGEAGMTR
jgi:hypothetical protein